MRAVCVNLPGGLENISIAEIEEPRAGLGQVLVHIAYAACNWGDIQKRQNNYPDPMTYPLFLGAEASESLRRLAKAFPVSNPASRLRSSAASTCCGHLPKKSPWRPNW